MTRELADPARDRPPPRWLLVAVITIVVLAAVASFLGGAYYESARSPASPAVTAVVVLVGPAASNFSFQTNCGGPQSSPDGYWECAIVVVNMGDAHDVILNVTAPLATNLVVYPPPPISVSPGGNGEVEVTGQLGYTGVVTVYLGIF
jgi:hypothetical protein